MTLKSKYKKIAFMALLMSFGGFGVYAQEAAIKTADPVSFYIVMGFVFVTALIVLRVSMVILNLLKTFVRLEAKKKAEARGEVFEEAKPDNWWGKFITKANDAIPVEEEESIILDHDYDGIKELDNHLPPWWKGIFYVSIVFGVVYLCVYHVFGTMPLQVEEYELAMTEAQEAALVRQANAPASNIDESNVEQVTDPALLAKGAQVFKNNCAACHREDGGGGIGPNLTDDYWLHGGGIKNIFSTIKHGVPEKGMISWEPLLSADQLQNVASYVMSIHGSNPANAKDPQGELYVEEGGESAPATEGVDSTAIAAPADSAAIAIAE